MLCQYRFKLIRCLFEGTTWMTKGGLAKKYCDKHADKMADAGWHRRS
jgi:hypothetical protein